MLEIANFIRRKKALENEILLFEFISKNPGLTGYDLTKKLNWTSGKVDRCLRKLLKDGLISNSSDVVNGRFKKSYIVRPATEFFNWDEMKSVKKEDLNPEYFNL